MLIVGRKPDQWIELTDGESTIRLCVVELRRTHTRIGIIAPDNWAIARQEVADAIQDSGRKLLSLAPASRERAEENRG